MASLTTPKLEMTFEQFEARYGENSRYEYWFGKAVERSSPTIVHGLLQAIIGQLLMREGYMAGSEIELRVIEEAHPKPDVIATKTKPRGRYPEKGWDVAVEILSDNDRFTNIREHCERYQEWGFGKIYLVDPSNRSVFEWHDGGTLPVMELAGIPVTRIWAELDLQYDPSSES